MKFTEKKCRKPDILVLELDHQRDKKRVVSYLIASNRSWEYILSEIEKCEVRCANCHRRKTAKQLGWYKWKKTQHQSASPNQVIGN